MHLNGEKCLNVICREKLAGNGQMDLRLMSEKIWTPGVCLPPPRGNIHVYYSDIQRSGVIYMYSTILVKQVYWYISRVSGELLQDHWSSGVRFLMRRFICLFQLS